jgi:hypothetical protein
MFQARRDPKSPLDGTYNDTEVSEISGRGVSYAGEKSDPGHIRVFDAQEQQLHSQPNKSSMKESRNSFSLTQRNLAHLNIASSYFQAVSHILILFEHIVRAV